MPGLLELIERGHSDGDGPNVPHVAALAGDKKSALIGVGRPPAGAHLEEPKPGATTLGENTLVVLILQRDTADR
jgi:hypothetical protein